MPNETNELTGGKAKSLSDIASSLGLKIDKEAARDMLKEAADEWHSQTVKSRVKKTLSV